MSKFTPATLLGQFADTNVINTNFQAIADVINDEMLSRDNGDLSEPNQLESDLDVNSKTLYNVPAGTENSHAVNLAQTLALLGDSTFTSTVIEIQTASASQTVFTLLTTQYTPGVNNIAVYVDGDRQYLGVQYTETSGTIITFGTPLAGSESLLFVVNERAVAADTVAASSVSITINGIQTNVSAYLNNKIALNYTDLRAKLGSGVLAAGDVVSVAAAGLAGEFNILVRTSQTDNKITVITDAGALYAQRIDFDLTLEMHEDVVGDGTTDDTTAINAALALGPTLFSQITATSAEYRCTDTITVPGSVALNTSKGGRSKFKFYADVIAFIMAGPVAHLRNRVTIELDTSVTGTKNCIEVGTAVVKANACEISTNILAYGTIASTAASVGDGIYIKNGNFVKIHDTNIELIGRDGLHVSDDTGDTNAGYIENTYVNVSGRDAYYFGPDVSGWRGTPNCLRFQRYGIMFDSARFNRLVGDIESVGNKGVAWTFGPDVFNGYVAGIRYASGAYGNEVQVFPVADHEFETIQEEQRNLCKRRAGANVWEATYGVTQFPDGFWINDETIAGELQFSQSGTAEYTINAGGTGGASVLKITQSGTGLAMSIDGTLEIIPDGRIVNPSVNADDLHVHAKTGNNVGISLVSANTQQASIRAADPQNDSAGTLIYDHVTNAWTINADDANAVRFDKSVTSGDTRFLLYDVDKGSMVRVSVGSASSGDPGFKVLQVPN